MRFSLTIYLHLSYGKKEGKDMVSITNYKSKNQ